MANSLYERLVKTEGITGIVKDVMVSTGAARSIVGLTTVRTGLDRELDHVHVVPVFTVLSGR